MQKKMGRCAGVHRGATARYMTPRPPPPLFFCMMDVLAARYLQEIDGLLREFAVDLLVLTGRQKHVSPQYLALAVPGLCHTHNPCAAPQPGCLYCRTHGNAALR